MGALLALASCAAGLTLAWHHPIAPAAALLLFCAAGVAAARWRGIWLVALPAGLPWLNFSPWTGWLVFDEFDLLVLAVFAGMYGRRAWSGVGRTARLPGLPAGLLLLGLVGALGVSGAAGLVRGLQDAGGLSFGWFQGYTDPLNSLRVFKSLLFGILTVPLLRDEMRISGTAASRRLALGMVLGLASVSLAVLWERAAFPGVFDFSTLYRVTALFWEMHVGGGAIDAYLAMAMPFPVWALASARGPLRWGLAATLALLAVNACLTTFSRGVYLAVALLLIPVAVLWRAQASSAGGPAALAAPQPAKRKTWRAMGARWSLGLAISLLVATVLVGGTLGAARFGMTERDFGGRLARWHAGLGLLDSTADWLIGLGLGRLPANYAQRVPRRAGEFSGRVEIHEPDPGTPQVPSHATVFGPATRFDLWGLYALTQRVAIEAGAVYSIRMDARAAAAAHVLVQLCERHLLYDWNCQDALFQVEGLPGQLQRLSAELSGDELGRGPWYAPRLGMLSISVIDRGGQVDFYKISLATADGRELLANGDFSSSLARWFPAAQAYFFPWHIDNLYLELLIERGIVGMLLLAGLVAWALLRLFSGPGRALGLAPYLAGSLTGALSIGMVSSVMDVPRVAFLFLLLVFFSLQLTEKGVPP